MLQSNQIINENTVPFVKNSAIDSQGKVRVLAFDIDFTQKETVAQEDIILVKLPKVNSRIIQIGLSSVEGTSKDNFNLVFMDSLHNNINNDFIIVTSTNIITGINFSNTGSAVLNINKTVEAVKDINMEKYIGLKASVPFTKKNILNGYVLYIMD